MENLQIEKIFEGETLTVEIKGDLNVKTSPQLEDELTKNLDGVKELILNFAEVQYISSAGLRVLLAMEKNMRKVGGKMKLQHINAAIKEIIRLAGFLQVMNIES